MKIIDLNCKGCGASIEFEEPDVEFTTEVNYANNSILFYKKDDSMLKMKCPYCGKRYFSWIAGKETSRVNGFITNTTINGDGNRVSVFSVGGDIVGSNINISL